MSIIKRIYGRDSTVYLTRVKLFPKIRGYRLMLHIFHRPDLDMFHDHPFDFWTMPLNFDYVEEELTFNGATLTHTVERGQWHRRSMYYAHRILYWRDFTHKKLLTLVIHGSYQRQWGFWVPGDPIDAMQRKCAGEVTRGSYRFVHWKEYLYGLSTNR